jgi:hypothetical protein
VSRTDGVRYRIREDRLAQTYVAWVRAFEAQKPHSSAARRAYTNFASGLMLRELVSANPLDVLAIPSESDLSNPAYYWPEGYVYVGYCLNVRSTVLSQDFGETLTLSPDLFDIRVWWSFKENVAEDPSLAIPFLDYFAGEQPNWSMPSVFLEEKTGLRDLASRQSGWPLLV